MTIKPFKVAGQIIAARYDDEGRVTGEFPVGEFVLWAPDFARLEERITEMWPDVEEKFGAQ